MTKILSKWYLLIVIGFLILAGGIFFVLGTDSVIAIHDNLDLFMPQYQMMKDTKTFFSQDVWVPFLGGVSRDYLPSEINLYTLLYVFLPGYYAYIAGYLLKIIISIVGFCLLSKACFKNAYAKYKGIVILTGFAYGILNLFPNFGICFASVPFLCFLIYKIVSKESKTVLWYVLLFFYPILSYFSYFGIFLVGFLFLYFIGRTITHKRFQGRVLIAAVVLSLGFVLCEYRLFLTMLFSGVESIRSGMVIDTMDTKGILYMIWEGIAKGDMHTEALQYKFVMPVCLVFAVYQIAVYLKEKEFKKVFKDPLFGIIAFIIFNGVIYGIYYCGPVRELFDKILKPLAGFQFTRAEYFNPFLWYAALFIVVKRIYDISLNNRFNPETGEINEEGKRKRVFAGIVAYGILLVSIFVTIVSGTRYNDLYHTCLSEYHYLRSGEKNNELSFKEFYSEELFAKALEDIDYHGEWAAAYGFYPAILEYNHINTIDGYLGYYSQSYKNMFRKMIAPSLDRRPDSAAYYDNWGARCTLYSGTYTTNVSSGRYYDIEEEELFIDTDEFKNLGARYIFARMNIINAAEMGFELVGTYAHEDSPYTLYVYRTISRYVEKEHSDIPYDEREIPYYDRENINAQIESINEYIKEANALRESNSELTDNEIVDSLGHGPEILGMYEDMLSTIEKMSTCYTMLNIKYYQNVYDESASEEMEQMYAEFLDTFDEYMILFRELCKSPYKATMLEIFSERDVESFIEYEDMTDEEKERSLKEESLTKEYLQAYEEEYYYDYNGETWSFELLSEHKDELERDTYYDILSGLYEQKTLVIGEIYKELVKIRVEEAKEEDYDSYLDYAYENVFCRDYDVDDVKALLKSIRKKGIKYCMAGSGYEPEIEIDYQEIVGDDLAFYEKIKPQLYDIDSELGNTVDNLIKLRLIDMDQGENKADAGFTTHIRTYGDAFIFDNPYGTYNDIFTRIHEFGHFNNMYNSNENMLYEKNNTDTAEIHSQGFEMLFSDYYKEIYGEELGAKLETAEVINIMSGIANEAIVTEFEIYVYEHPDESITDYSKQYAKICKYYGMQSAIVNSTGGYDFWIDTNHLFAQPGYYISYLTTALTSMEIYSMSKENRDEAVSKYMDLTALPSYYFYRYAMYRTGFSDVFEDDNAAKILKSTYLIIKDLSEQD